MLSQRKFLHEQRGFSMVELIMVVAILAILAVITIPQLAAYRTKAYNAAAQSDLGNFRSMMEAAFHDERSSPLV